MNEDVNTYIAQFPDETRRRLETLRGFVTEQCPQELLALHGFGPKALRILREAGVNLAP